MAVIASTSVFHPCPQPHSCNSPNSWFHSPLPSVSPAPLRESTPVVDAHGPPGWPKIIVEPRPQIAIMDACTSECACCLTTCIANHVVESLRDSIIGYVSLVEADILERYLCCALGESPKASVVTLGVPLEDPCENLSPSTELRDSHFETCPLRQALCDLKRTLPSPECHVVEVHGP